jgi:metal-dependent amidase/aminoacylase/carboxypeptidase family protein
VNQSAQTQIAAQAAGSVLGMEQVSIEMEPVMGSEDFAFMLEAKPGAYLFLGQGGSQNSA